MCWRNISPQLRHWHPASLLLLAIVQPKQSLCRYTAEGTLAKIPLSPQQPAPQPSGGPLRRHIMEKKIEEVQEEGPKCGASWAFTFP
jgi:hypothetical protein